MKKTAIIALCLLLAVCGCSCGQTSVPTPLVSTNDNAWYNPYDQSSATEITLTEAVDYSQKISIKLSQYALLADENAVKDLAAIEKELQKYMGGTNADTAYINALRKLLHCITGFYTYNSTEAMLNGAIAEVQSTYSAMNAQMQAAYYQPTDADIRVTAANIAELADNAQ